MNTYKFLVVLWNETGNILKHQTFDFQQASNEYNAKTKTIKKYPFPYFVELQSITR